MRCLLRPLLIALIAATTAAAVLTGTAYAQSATTDPPPLSIRVTGEATVTAAPPRTAALAAELPTPVEPGTIDVDARVRLTVEIRGAE